MPSKQQQVSEVNSGLDERQDCNSGLQIPIRGKNGIADGPDMLVLTFRLPAGGYGIYVLFIQKDTFSIWSRQRGR